jgi:exopolysaccharide biosynthesis polyprenyl glycosylphosphotransferase
MGVESRKVTAVADQVEPSRPDRTTERARAGFVRTPRRGGADVGEIREGRRTWSVAHRDTLFRRVLAAADMLAAGVGLCLAILLGGDVPTLGVVGLLPLVVLTAKVAGLYDRDEHLLRKTTLDEAPALLQVATTFALVSWLAQPLLLSKGAFGRPQVLALWLLLLGLLLVGRATGRRLVLAVTEPERCLVLGDRRDCEDLRRMFERSAAVNATIVGRVPLRDEGVAEPANGNGHARRFERPAVDGNGAGPASNGQVLGSFGQLADLLLDLAVDRVIMAAPPSPDDKQLEQIRLVKSLGIKVSVLPRLFEVVGSSVEVDDLGGMTLLGLRRYELTTSSQLLKRALDVTVSVALLVLMAPLLATIAVAIRLGSPGPILFRQRRVGRHGVSFEMLKFRTMYDGADQLKDELLHLNEADGLFKIADDPRITPIGRLLRRTSLDEVPQLLNVLRGDMSLVGPRPLVTDEDARIGGWLRRRLDVVPGMTGAWQVLGSSRIPLAEMVKLDYLYRANWSLWLDIKILLRTIPFVVQRRGL